VAEGIEREDQRELLVELGCDLGQGYLLSRPLDAAAAGQLLVASV
jgi:EAL domain-containing protein (putative c-di-GMP-specific phosphodiesterase class I)